MSLHDFLNIIIMQKKLILTVTASAMIFFLLLFFFVYPVTFKSVVTVLPPEKNSEFSGLGSLLAGQDFSGLMSGGASTANSQLFIEMLKSRSASEYVIKKYNLLKYYNSDNIQEAAEKINKKLEIELTKEGIIKLSVEVSSSLFPMIYDEPDTLKIFSANLSNSFIEALDLINREKLSSKAKKAREYIEEQLIITKIHLDSAETALMDFQKVNKAISLPEQVQAAIDAAAGLKTEIIKTEVELGLLESNLREDNKNLLALREKLVELKSQYSRMELGNKDYLLAFKEIPSLGRQLASLLRDVKIQNEVYLLLQQQYYKEKIQETRDLPTVDILDAAIPPIKKSSPRILYSTLIGGVFVFLLMSLIVVFKQKKIIIFRGKNE